MNSTAAQNAAHAADLTWARVGSSYIRSDGAQIVKGATGRFTVRTPAGDNLGSFSSLSWAKACAAVEIPA